MRFKRFLALLLVTLMVISLLPTVSALSIRDGQDGDIWELIGDYEDQRLSVNTRAASGRVYQPTAADFATMSEGVESVVRSWSEFREGTISRHGEFFFWEDVDGNAYGYSPRLRAQIREDAAKATADPETLAGIETVDYSTRGGSAGSLNVAVFQPYYGIDSSFKTTYSTEGTRIAKATGGTSTTYKTTAATIDQVANALQTCGVVMFDSHGDTDYASGEDYTSRANTSYLCMQTNAGWTSADQKAVTGPYGTYYHCYNGGGYGTMKYYMVDGTGFANHMTGKGCNNMLWMAICLGMATDGLNKPLHNKGVEVIYGYSQSVSFDGDYEYEEYFWDDMIAGHTAGEAFAYMKTKAKCNWDPAYSDYSTETQARNNRVAFPILVSSEEAYPGHGNVDKVTTPKSTWTLLPTYTVSAVSNNTAWGTVSVNGTVITASPKEGYYAAGYEVTAGTAKVTQDGNTFNVSPSSDCTVRINFAAKTPATVSFVTPDGVVCADLNTYVGETVALPAPTGAPTANAESYRFVGWTTAQCTDTETRPDFLRAGTEIKVTGNVTYYALYAYKVGGTGEIGSYVKLTEAPAIWTGEYVITYNGSVVLDASGNYTGASLGSKEAAIPVADTGIQADGETITEVSDDYLYEIEPSPSQAGCYTIRMKGNDNYLAYTGTTNTITTTTAAGDASAQWKLSFNGSTVSIQNATTTTRYLQYNTTSKIFRCYSNSMKNLTLFSGETGTNYYTTELRDGCAHDYVLSDSVAPTCTEDGSNTYTCSICGNSYSETVPALGHDWGEASYVWSEDNSEVTATRVCKRDESHKETETVKTTSEVTVLATVESEGEITYTAVFENKAFETQVKKVATPKLEPTDPCVDGHDWDEPSYVWAEDYSSVTATRVCKRDESHVETETAKTESAVTKPATEDEEGEIIYTAVFENEAFGIQEKAVVLPKITKPVFVDVKVDAYYADAVDWAVEQNVTNGIDATHFAPDTDCTRAQVVTFLWRAAGEPEPEVLKDGDLDGVPFVDLKANGFYYKAVLWAVENGITAGVDETHFAPDANCTRAQVVTFLWRASDSPVPGAVEIAFEDVNPESYYYNAMLWAVENDVTKGVDSTHFAPSASCTRGQIVTFLYRAQPKAE